MVLKANLKEATDNIFVYLSFPNNATMKVNTFIFKVLSLVFLLGLALTGEAALKKDSLLLQYQLISGQEYKVIYYMTNRIQTEAVGYSVSLDQNMNTYYTTNMINDVEGVYQLETRIEKITGTQKMMGMESTYDSEDTIQPTDPMGKELKRTLDGLIGRMISMKIDKRGNVLNSDYLDTFSQAGSGGMFMFDNSQTWYTIYPTKRLKPGSTWENELTIGGGDFSFKSITTHTLTYAKKGRAFIEVSTVYQPVEGSKMKEISGTMTGTIEVDIKTGFPIKSESVQKMDIVLHEQGMKVSVKIDANVTMVIN
ncbi:MAG: DUF6263 family protein [Bacteroidales bacterium]|nr:DUF6263 family protein [Bacteroidales bacterium]